MAITDDDGYLFVGEGRDSIAVFSVEDRSNPRRLATLERSRADDSHWSQNICSFSDARPGSLTVDVFCDRLAFSVRWDSEAGELKSTDWSLPHASQAVDFDLLEGFAVSPEDRHLYVSTRSDGIAIFARDGGDDPSGSYCRDGDDVESGSSCAIYDTPLTFDVDSRSTACLRASGIELCSDATHDWRGTEIDGITFTFVGEKNEDGSWTIEDVEPEPRSNG
ncbi:MAG: hypothetical protein OXH15_17440 [Gammaproteobacteria bacterium]|nr:hypothetical protein [Gammaproteobacteria bacterium]